jgi:ferric-dicitrate binding protein FerR (iron transport regulator)
MSPPKPKLSAQILEEASDWFVEFDEGTVDAAAREQFDAWLRRSPEHVHAYLQITALWEEVPLLANTRTLSANELLAQVRSATNVVALNPPKLPADQSVSDSAATSSSPPPAPSLDKGQNELIGTAPYSLQATAVPVATKRFGRFSPLRFAAVAACVAIIAATGFWFYALRDTYSTGFGEQRSVRLDDGSTVDLNSKSKIRIRFSEHERNILLLEGQALFRVAKNTARPFIVTTTETHVRAVGTEFDVYQRNGGTVVTVLEGRVAVLSATTPSHASDVSAQSASLAAAGVSDQPGSHITAPPDSAGQGAAQGGRGRSLISTIAKRPGSKASSPAVADLSSSPAAEPLPAALAPHPGEILLAAGEQVMVSANTASQPRPADLLAAIAWTQHKIVFHGAPLTDVVEEFNRYNSRKIVIIDANLMSMKISGVFSSADADSFLKFLRALPDISIDDTGANIRILHK